MPLRLSLTQKPLAFAACVSLPCSQLAEAVFYPAKTGTQTDLPNAA